MSDAARNEPGLFASRSVAVHVLRGAIAATLVAWAWLHQSSDPAFAVGAGILALVAMRGCPACWTIGLIETVAERISARRSGRASGSTHVGTCCPTVGFGRDARSDGRR